MAARVRMLKLLQEIRGFAEMAQRRPAPRTPALVVSQIRAFGSRGGLRARKLTITIHPESQADVPHRVKIVHVKPTAPPATRLPAP